MNNDMKPKILYVEDQEEAAQMIAAILKKDYDVIYALTVDEAFDKLESDKFNLILMDIQLQSKYAGLELIGRLKSDERYKSIPIIALTAYAQRGDREKMLAGGADDYVSKPFNKAVLIEKINNLLSKVT